MLCIIYDLVNGNIQVSAPLPTADKCLPTRQVVPVANIIRYYVSQFMVPHNNCNLLVLKLF